MKLPIAPFVTESLVVELIAWRLGPHRLTVKQGHYRDRPSQKEKLRANSAAVRGDLVRSTCSLLAIVVG